MRLATLTLLALFSTSSLGGVPAPRQEPPDFGVNSRTGMVVSATGEASDIGAAILATAGMPWTRRWQRRSPWPSRIRSPATSAAAASWSSAPPAAQRRVRLPGEGAGQVHADDVPGRDGNIDRSLTQAGYLAPGVPGTVRGMALAHKKFGKLPWKDVVHAGGRRSPTKGFAIAPLARGLNRKSRVMRRFPLVAAYGKPGGGQWAAGDRLCCPISRKRLKASRLTARTRSTRAGSPIASRRTWPPTAA